MRKTIATALMAILVSGCAGMSYDGGPAPSGPLQAYLLPTAEFGGGLSFHVNRPAHVAVFQIFPGRGASLIYPTPGFASLEGRVFSGLHRTDFNSRHNRAQFMEYGFVGFGPEFYLMLASEQPLRTERFGPFGDGLAFALGTSFASVNAYSTMERLVSLTVPNVDSEGWVADYFVQWPDALQAPHHPDVVQLTCNGNTYHVRHDLAQLAYQQLCQPELDVEPDDEQPTDSDDDTVVPTRRDPVDPVRERIVSTQLRDREGWEAMRRAVAEDRWEEFTARTTGFDRERPDPGAGLRDTRRSADEFGDRSPRSRAGARSGAPSTTRARPAARSGGSSDAGSAGSTPTRARPAPSGDGSSGRSTTDSPGSRGPSDE
ncbi:MAG: hypothetical protein WD766_06545 [Gemmatimonadota bacterium]